MAAAITSFCNVCNQVMAPPTTSTYKKLTPLGMCAPFLAGRTFCSDKSAVAVAHWLVEHVAVAARATLGRHRCRRRTEWRVRDRLAAMGDPGMAALACVGSFAGARGRRGSAQ
eukprot:CAMPEP_0119388990 /NCGR_PEP_ID=MMETSP1334-20130426/107247_1 /TAXON_ID=127549 /ORGANISM="Calcidiscus leptoporus, Strain RCC1130" /LENGTH=112 /DNA_ID=CAMNT_0007411119 /DNA_START=406 /DNA_END=741 /DNA_ORIENTATION=+